jgi:hypothetical protein
MSIKIEDLQEKLGEDFEPLQQYVSDLIGQRDAARSESINGRKGLKAEVEQLRGLKAKLYDRLGIAEDEELDNLPDLKGQAEAVKVFEARLKRFERELGEKSSALTTAEQKYRAFKQEALLSKAMADQEWIDREVVEYAIQKHIVWEDDQPFFDTGKGAVPLDEGVKLFAQEKPSLLKSTGAGGSGYQRGGSGAAANVKNPWKRETLNLTEQGKLVRENPALAAQLKEAAMGN